jgi:hypothetical protein
MAVLYSLWSVGILFPFWYVFTKKNLATLVAALTQHSWQQQQKAHQ